MASASTSTAVSPPTDSCSYQIFLNHRGPDTKNTFTTHLYRRLVSHGFRVFWDKKEMKVGDPLTPQIQDAVKAASLHVAVFSPGYADSTWCLQELLLMVESKKPIIPIFYRVRPTDLRRTQGKGVYAQALRKLQPRHDSTTIEKWRTALSTVADISGLELATFNGDEGELLDKVVESVLKKMERTRLDVAEHPTGLERTPLDVAEHPTGLDEKIEDFEKNVLSVQPQQSGKPQVIGIVGFGGIGKTTLVKELFNRKRSQYQKSCFLFDVRENARRFSLESLQKKLLKALAQTDVNIESVSHGIGLLKTSLSSSCEALVILDDVDHISQLDALLRPIRDNLHPRSLIVITSRDKDVLRTSKVEESSTYKLTGLDIQHSQELFCRHAFNQGHPLTGFEDLVRGYLQACDGLPLSLRVFGGLLYGNDESFWQHLLDRLERILPKDIQKSLKISFDALHGDEKDMFLDVACFFIGKNRDTAIRIWDGSDWSGWLGFRSLQNKNLVEVDTENNIRMHDHLRDLGRELAKSPGLPRRIWRTEDFEDLLQQSCDTDVRGISINVTNMEELSFSRCKIRNLQLLHIHSGLYIRGKHPLERIQYALESPNLIWFSCYRHHRASPPSWIPTKKLRVLELEGWNFKTLWQESQIARQRSLEVLHLREFAELPSDIGELKNLKSLNLDFCHRLESLADSLGQLNQLTELRVNYLGLREVSFKMVEGERESINCPNLQHLQISHCNCLVEVGTLPDALTTLELTYCSSLRKIEWSSPLSKLRVLNLQWCRRLKQLPSLETLVSLEELHLGKLRELAELPSDMGELKNLKSLNLDHCHRLESLPDSLGQLNQLTELTISWCSRLREVSFKMVEGERESINCPNLQHLQINFCSQLVEVGTLPDALTTLKLSYCTQLRKIEWASPLSKLRVLNLRSCHTLEQLPSL